MRPVARREAYRRRQNSMCVECNLLSELGAEDQQPKDLPHKSDSLVCLFVEVC